MGLKRTALMFAGSRALEPVIDQVAERLAVVTERGVEEIVNRRGLSIAADADVFRLRHSALDAGALDRALVADRRWRCAAMGALTALPGVVPGAGTAVEVVAAAADALNLTYQQVELALALGHLHGRDIREVESRRLDVLLVLGIEAGVVRRENERLVGEDLELGLEDLQPGAMSSQVLGQLNRTVGERVVRRVARRRARAAVGRLLPAGIGVAIAAGTDYLAARSAGNATLLYLDWVESAQPSRASLTAA